MSFQELSALGADAVWLHCFEQQPAGCIPGRVVGVERTLLRVHDGVDERACSAVPALSTSVVVGDWVTVVDGDPPFVVQRLPRRSLLARGRGHGKQPLVANVDRALLVMGLDHDFNARRLERYLVLVQSGGVAPVVVLSKADAQVDAEARADALRTRLGHGVPVVAVDARDASAAALLQPWLQPAQTLVLLGSSGVGKSTLVNTLHGSDRQRTGAVRAGDDRGRHTTTTRTLLSLPGGACLIDTPGLRAVSLQGGENLDAAFTDIGALARECRFRDCRHRGEPGCAVVESIETDRLESYRKLDAELVHRSDDPLVRAERKRIDKTQHKALYRFLDARRRGR